MENSSYISTLNKTCNVYFRLNIDIGMSTGRQWPSCQFFDLDLDLDLDHTSVDDKQRHCILCKVSLKINSNVNPPFLIEHALVSYKMVAFNVHFTSVLASCVR